MSNYDFSVILTTIRGPNELEPLFEVADEDSEIIITDSNYNTHTKEWLEQQKGYKQIVYVPVERRSIRYTKDNVLGYNIAFMFAENDWIIRADDNLEFRDNFFDTARKDIDYFKETLGNERFGIIGRKLWGSLGEERWGNTDNDSGPRYNQVTDSQSTFSFGIIPIEMIYDLNGYQEIYDLGWGFDDRDFLDRGNVAGYQYWFDRELMAYSYPHRPSVPTFSVNKFIYELQLLEIKCGKFYAYNSYNIRQSQAGILARKEDFIINR